MGFENPNPLATFFSYVCSERVPQSFFTEGTSIQPAPLRCAKFCQCNDTKVRLADIRCALGWNFLLKDDYHLGVDLQCAFPTGNRPKGEFLFEPIDGNE